MSRPPTPFAHTAIRASAGTGKTYQLTNRFIGLLDAGVDADRILATTFTRKAAWEILQRLMLRTAEAALKKDKARELGAAIGNNNLSPERCLELLQGILARLHRLRIGTLDSFFITMARVFGLELEIPPGWSIVEEHEDRILRDTAILMLLEKHGKEAITELLRAIQGGNYSRNVHDGIYKFATESYPLYLKTTSDAWGVEPVTQKLDKNSLKKALKELKNLPVPTTQKGEPNKSYQKGLKKTWEAAEEDNWDAFIKKGIASKIICGDNTYQRQEITDLTKKVFLPLIDHAAAELIGRLLDKTRGIRDLLQAFDAEYGRLKAAQAAFRFNDITHILAAGARLDQERSIFNDMNEVYLRMDGLIPHILLDEFQDTSLEQWYALKPLVENILQSDTDQKNSFFVVGDKKQAIYGWRGGESGLLTALSKRDRVEDSSLAESYRSSKVVIDFVNSLFLELDKNPAFAGKPNDQVAAQNWAADFEAQKTHMTKLAGTIECVAAPPPEGDDKFEPILRLAVDKVKEINDTRTGWRIGILFRKNKHIARMIHALRKQDILASEEGGNPLTDSPAVVAALSLLTLADHPGNTAARFHVGSSPLGKAVELDGLSDPHETRIVSRRVRRELQVHGFAPTLRRWLLEMAPDCNEPDCRRFQQLIHLAQAFDAKSGVRATDFVRMVREKRVEDPTAAPIRVMTVHQAKGLEFDAVVLPELDGDLFSPSPDFLTSTRPLQFPDKVSLYARKELRLLHEELMRMHDQWREATLQEELCNLYVALTRAIHGVYLYMPSTKKQLDGGGTTSFATILRGAFTDGGAIPPGPVFETMGNPSWYKKEQPKDGRKEDSKPQVVKPVLAPPPAKRLRNLLRETPSGLPGGPKRTLSRQLSLEDAVAMKRGSIVHAWFEHIEWLDIKGQVPDEKTLLEAARDFGVEEKALNDWMGDFRKICTQESVVHTLSHGAYESWGDCDLEVLREYPFAVREKDMLMTGKFDRLVVGRQKGKALFVDVVDFKTDRPSNDSEDSMDPADKLVKEYAPQIQAYRRAAAHLFGLEPANITARLVFVSFPGGLVREIPAE